MSLSERYPAKRYGVIPLLGPRKKFDIKSFSDRVASPDFGNETVGSEERVTVGIIGEANVSQYFSLGRRIQLAKAFGKGTDKKFYNIGDGMKENDDVESVSAHRVTGQQLYDYLVDSRGRHWFDDFYRGDLLTLTQYFLENRKIYPADTPKGAYVGNGLLVPEHRFIVHEDTKKTASALIFINDVPEGMGGEFKIAMDRRVRGVEALEQSFGNITKPMPYHALFFYGQKPHGSFPIIEDAFPRLAIACTYYLPGYSTDLRAPGFNENRG